MKPISKPDKQDRADYGISPIPSREVWMVRVRVRLPNQPVKIIARTVSWNAHGGKSRSKQLARQIRDELLNQRKVEYLDVYGSETPIPYHKNKRVRGKPFLTRLIGISLAQKKLKSGGGTWYFRAACGRSVEGKPRLFAVHHYGLRGALEKAVEYRESVLGTVVYSRHDVEKDYRELVRAHGKELNAYGLSLEYDAKTDKSPMWSTMNYDALKRALPVGTPHNGVYISIVTIKGRRQIRMVGASPNREGHCMTRSIRQGMWQPFCECIDFARIDRSLRPFTLKEKAAIYDQWLRGCRRQLKRIGIDTTRPKEQKA